MQGGIYIYIYIYMQGGSAHALIFSWACWSGIWPRSDARLRLRRLAGPNWLVGWFGWLQPKNPKDASKYMKKSVFGTEKTPEGAPRYWWLAWIHNIPLKQTQEASKSKIGFPSKTARLIVNLQPDRPFSMPRSYLEDPFTSLLLDCSEMASGAI